MSPAPVRTAAHKALTKNLKRARYFLDLHEGTQVGPGTPDNKRRELPRGAVVFAVGALDAYLSEVSAEMMLAQFNEGNLNGGNRDLLKSILRLNPTLPLEAALIGDDQDRRELVRSSITEYFYTAQSNHGAGAVSATVERMNAKPTAVWNRVSDLGESSPQKDLDDWTDKRHAIVHRGEAPVVNREPGRSCVTLIERIGLAVDEAAIAQLPPA